MHTHTNGPENSPDMTARQPSLTPLRVFASLHLTGDNPQFRTILARQVDVTRCPPVRLIWINRAEETGRGEKICLHYDGKREDGIQPRGSVLYAHLIKCLTAPVDGITDCWTKSCAEDMCVCVSVCAVQSGQLGFRGLTVFGLWQACRTTPPRTMHNPPTKPFAVHHSGRPREVPWEEVRCGGERVGEEWSGVWGRRGRREGWSGVKCREDSDERQLSCTSARPGAPVSRRTCKVCRSRPDNTPTFLRAHTHTQTYQHTHIQALRKRLMLHRWRGIARLTACQSSCRWLLRICKEKLGWWGKKHMGGSEEESLRHEQTTWSEQTLLTDLMQSKCWNNRYKKLHKSKYGITRRGCSRQKVAEVIQVVYCKQTSYQSPWHEGLKPFRHTVLVHYVLLL